MTVKCSICGKRPAIIYRSSSGEYICRNCLEKVVRKNVKRTLARSRILKACSNIMLYATWLAPVESIVMTRVVPRVEARYKTRITLAYPEGMESLIFQDVAERSPYEWSGRKGFLAECILNDIGHARSLCESKGCDAIVTPYPRLMLVKAGLQAVMAGRTDLLKASRQYHPEDPPIVNALSGLEKELILQYAYVNNIPLLDPGDSCDDLGAGDVLMSILPESREVEFSSLKALVELSKFS
ncbi:MAG: hypothetical protein GSR76_00065 [Desulfurococcales archaeon]|nr:hypothetical protein [Desulfurococcales archaeon]